MNDDIVGGARVWSLMYSYVEAQNRRAELADALGFRLGGGRGKVLFSLRERPMTLRELAEANNVDAPYTTLIVDKLERHGLVERRPHPDDRRRKLVTLTDTGWHAIATADTVLSRPPASVSTLSDDELAHLATLLSRLLDAERASAVDDTATDD
ncbi:MarR family winged helix-turn-helix transcriptional regulator [Williamsia sp. M5A3_1d]